jgi:hypothetical protein
VRTRGCRKRSGSPGASSGARERVEGADRLTGIDPGDRGGVAQRAPVTQDGRRPGEIGGARHREAVQTRQQ